MLKELLRDTFAYIQPAAAISNLDPEDANRRLEGATHSVVEIVAHMTFWQDWFLARCRGESLPMIASAADGWPRVSADDWIALHDRFLEGLDRAVALAADEEAIAGHLSPPIDFPPFANYTVRDALTHVAVHNAHHLGQVVTLRQLMGRWPPPSGSWTW